MYIICVYTHIGTHKHLSEFKCKQSYSLVVKLNNIIFNLTLNNFCRKEDPTVFDSLLPQPVWVWSVLVLEQVSSRSSKSNGDTSFLTQGVFPQKKRVEHGLMKIKLYLWGFRIGYLYSNTVLVLYLKQPYISVTRFRD